MSPYLPCLTPSSFPSPPCPRPSLHCIFFLDSYSVIENLNLSSSFSVHLLQMDSGLKKYASQPSLSHAPVQLPKGMGVAGLALGNPVGGAPFLFLLGALLEWDILVYCGWVGVEWGGTLTLLSSISWPS